MKASRWWTEIENFKSQIDFVIFKDIILDIWFYIDMISCYGYGRRFAALEFWAL